MSRSGRHLRVPAARCDRGESGFALASVLGVIALTSLVIAALLGLLLTTILATSAQERAARELRAADGAIEAAVAQARFDPVATDPCAVAAPLVPLTSIEFDQGSPAGGDDVAVEVTCGSGVLGDSPSTADQVRLVGPSGYQGDVPWATNCAAGAPGPGCLPWTAATGAAAPGIVPSLVHSGPQPLRFDSGVTARRSAAVLRNPVDGTPAVITSGQYLQGDAGPGRTAGEVCGILSPRFGGTGAGVVDDLDDAPVCNSSAAASVDGDTTDRVVGFAVTNATPAVPPCSGSVVRILPGRYDTVRTQALNALLASCSNRTFHFEPGVFAFDADSGVAGPNRNAVVLGNAGSAYVFGAPSGWSPASGVAASAVATDPEALLCDTAQSGTSLVLSGRTEIRHLAGRVSICPAFNPADIDEPFPAIYQETSIPGVTATPAVPLPRTFSYTWNCFAFLTNCTVSRAHDVLVSSSGTRPLTSIRLLVTGSEPDNTQTNLISNRTTRVDIRRNSDNFLICSTGEMSGMPNGGLTSSFELRTGSCATALSNEATLNNVRLRVFHSLRLNGILVAQNLAITGVGLQLNSAFARSTPAGVSDPDGNWTGVGNVAADDGASAAPVMPCTFAACAVDGPRTPGQPFTHRFGLGDLRASLPPELSGLGDAAGIESLRVLMKIDPSSAPLPPALGALPADNFRPEMTTRLRLTTAAGDRCSVTGGWVNSAQEIAFDLLSSDGGEPGCSAVLETFGQVQGADLSVTFELPCIRNWLQNTPSQCMPEDVFTPTGRVWQVRPPSVQAVTVAMSSDSYTGPPSTSLVTVDAAAAASTSTFHVAGNVWMPTSDLDVRWRGAVTARPVIAGDLILNGLGSDMFAAAQAGVVCCSVARPDSRTVRLVARIDGDDTLAVTVRFTDIDEAGAYSPGHAVDILEWETVSS